MKLLDLSPTKLALSIIGLLPSLAFSLPQDQMADCLTQAYPEINQVNNGVIYFNNGKTLPLGQKSNKPFIQVLNNASVADQLSQTYPLGFGVPKQYEDAGRIRNDEFFKIMYGQNAQQVNQNLVTINWKPANIKLRFNKVNGAAAQLEKVGQEIAKNPALVQYVNQSLGTFNWRFIHGTNRLSNHSFGISVDFKLPKKVHKYWKWDGCKSEDKACPYPRSLIEDQNLQEVVKIFEKHGFIWGGKWASYDSPHFEYRPELLIKQCRS